MKSHVTAQFMMIELRTLCQSDCVKAYDDLGIFCRATVLPAKSDSDFMFCLQSYQGHRVDDKMHHAAFHLGIHCMPKYAYIFRSHWYTKC